MTLQKTLDWRTALIRHAGSFTYVREYAGPNRGEGVEAMQASTGNKPPDYWCMSFVYRCVRRILGKILLRSASCDEQRDYARRKGALRTREQFLEKIKAEGPQSVLGWIFLCVKALPDGSIDAHHTGFVGYVKDDLDTILGAQADGSFYTTEGNAADPKNTASRDGNGAYGGRLRGSTTDKTTYEFIDPESL